MKVYIKNIDSCDTCPNLRYDQNITRYECNANCGKFLMWMGSNEDDHIDIPSWCPLPDEFLNEGDMVI